jgi:hypothetical protein
MKVINTLLISTISAIPYTGSNELSNKQQPQINENLLYGTATSGRKDLVLNSDNNGQVQEKSRDSANYAGSKFYSFNPVDEDPKYYTGLLLEPGWDNQPQNNLDEIDFPKVDTSFSDLFGKGQADVKKKESTSENAIPAPVGSGNTQFESIVKDEAPIDSDNFTPKQVESIDFPDYMSNSG